MQKVWWFGGVLLLTLTFSCRQAEKPAVEFVENKQMLPPNERWGELFEAVQLARVFPDSKTFVDCEPKYPTDQIMSSYSTLKEEEEFHLRAFVLENFDLPPDYASGFESDPNRTMADHISALWPVLTRQPDEAGKGSLISLPNPYVVPGGRFREVYYWDSYFTMLGMQVDGEVELIENMVKNFAYLIDSVGFIPNGNRSYYLTRSQPPFFTSMVNLLAEMKGPQAVMEYLPALRKEYAFWMNGEAEIDESNNAIEHVVRMPDGSLLNRYYDQGDYPRAESYAEDIETAKEDGSRPAAEIYRHLRSGAESGWDYSVRWFADGQNIASIHTTDIIPVDLNALLYNLELTIAKGYDLRNEEAEKQAFLIRAEVRKAALNKYCWDAASNFYRDYDFVAGEVTPIMSLAAAYPLFFHMASEEQAAQVAARLEAEFLQAGGLSSTLVKSGQQWDAPNGWAPLQWMAYLGLRHYDHDELATTIADRWIANNVRVYQNTAKMVEKYNVHDITLEAGGGEYDLQDGFGWSNGVAMRFLLELQE